MHVGGGFGTNQIWTEDFQSDFGLSECRSESGLRNSRCGNRIVRKIEIVRRPVIAKSVHQYNARQAHMIFAGGLNFRLILLVDLVV